MIYIFWLSVFLWWMLTWKRQYNIHRVSMFDKYSTAGQALCHSQQPSKQSGNARVVCAWTPRFIGGSCLLCPVPQEVHDTVLHHLTFLTLCFYLGLGKENPRSRWRVETLLALYPLVHSAFGKVAVSSCWFLSTLPVFVDPLKTSQLSKIPSHWTSFQLPLWAHIYVQINSIW